MMHGNYLQTKCKEPWGATFRKAILEVKVRRNQKKKKRQKPVWRNKTAMQKVKKYDAWKRFTNANQYIDYQLCVTAKQGMKLPKK